MMTKSNRQKEKLIDAFLQMDNQDKLKNFLDGILTPKEIDEISVRLQIIKMLKEGVPQHKIAERLGLGVATVTRGSKELQKGNFKYV